MKMMLVVIENMQMMDKDKIVVDHGSTEPGVWSNLSVQRTSSLTSDSIRELINSFSGPEGLERFNSLLLDNENDAGCDREYADDG
jgi:hypothetical protein